MTHDAGVAVVENGTLLFSIEVEKIANRHRYASMPSVETIEQVLQTEGLKPDDIDRFVIDGWWPEGDDDQPCVRTSVRGQSIRLPVASYTETPAGALDRSFFDGLPLAGGAQPYSSYHHVTGHVLSAYCSSPFAGRGEGALVVVWDGAITPRLYWVDPESFTVRSFGPLMWVVGNMFADFCSHLGPFHDPAYGDISNRYDEAGVLHHLGIAGKAMAYAGLGTVDRGLFSSFDDFFDGLDEISRSDAFALGARVLRERDTTFGGHSDADLIATFQEYLGTLLRDRLEAFVDRTFRGEPVGLILSGGCALNIKWNSMIRDTGRYRDVWIPPFPNDSGSAIGAACSEMFSGEHSAALEWDVYRGPALTTAEIPRGWQARACDQRELARILHDEGEPVVILSGRAELGPRALGQRSVVAPAVSPQAKERLNQIKHRAAYRPVAPICLEEYSSEVFAPGGQDPYMLFDHTVRPQWRERIPAVLHLDGTARLQTVPSTSSSPIRRILAEYHALSGIPVLCNTSANLNGSGFFPDVASAAEWAGTQHVWSEGNLYSQVMDLKNTEPV